MLALPQIKQLVGERRELQSETRHELIYIILNNNVKVL